MCGISGFLDPSGAIHQSEHVLQAMTDSLVHRGPDAQGHWHDSDQRIALGHRRLSIIDLSADGAQPMMSASQRYVIAFNGEIYNFIAIRKELEKSGLGFRGHSDTEVMLAAIESWGLLPALEKFNGMFAFALWDRKDRVLWLGRDRLGKKPLYYGWVNKTLVFASELKAFRAIPGFRPRISRSAIAAFLRHNYVPTPYCIYEELSKLESGTVASFHIRDGAVIAADKLTFWSVSQAAGSAANDPYQGSIEDATVDLDTLLRDAVGIRTIADVPVGAFLSGGIDSSLVVALMQSGQGSPARTFTVGFGESDYNEAVYAKKVAKHLGTDHTEIILSPSEALKIVPQLPSIYDEPFADSSQIPTYLVCREARQHATVCLSGDGGDEGFCGYNRYIWWRQLWKVMRWLPQPVRNGVSSALMAAQPETLSQIVRPLLRMLPNRFRYDSAGERIHKIAAVLVESSPDALYHRLISHWTNPASVVLGGTDPIDGRYINSGVTGLDEFTKHMMVLDTGNYLPDDILVKVDRASMAVSLEVRAPLLDYRVLEFAMRLPLSYKLRGTTGKVILRKLLAQYVPESLFDRAKTGFGIPIDQWLRGPLRPWAEDLLAENRLRAQGYFDVDAVRAVWMDHVNARRAGHYLLWDILMFQAWLDESNRG